MAEATKVELMDDHQQGSDPLVAWQVGSNTAPQREGQTAEAWLVTVGGHNRVWFSDATLRQGVPVVRIGHDAVVVGSLAPWGVILRALWCRLRGRALIGASSRS